MAEHVFKLKAELDTSQAQSQLKQLESAQSPEIASAANGISKSLKGLETTLKSGSSSLDKAFNALKRIASSFGAGKAVGIGSAFGPIGAGIGIGAGLITALVSLQQSIDAEKVKIQEGLNSLAEQFDKTATEMAKTFTYFDKIQASRDAKQQAEQFTNVKDVENELAFRQNELAEYEKSQTGFGSWRSKIIDLRRQRDERIAGAQTPEEITTLEHYYNSLENELKEQYKDAIEQHNAMQAYIAALEAQAKALKTQEADYAKISEGYEERNRQETKAYEEMQASIAAEAKRLGEAAAQRSVEETEAFYTMLNGVQLEEIQQEKSTLQSLMSGIEGAQVATTSLAKVGMYMGEQDAQSRYVDERMTLLRSIVDRLIGIDLTTQRIKDEGILTSTILG